MKPPKASDVLRVGSLPADALTHLLSRYALQLCWAADGENITGSYWGEPEAGLVGQQIWVRTDTPVHSLLHETAHFVCMNSARRESLDTNAGGDYVEENGVCFLQILLAEELDGVGRERMLADMDRWGYTFRLGSAASWFSDDAADALDWLRANGLLTAEGRPNGNVRI